MAPISLAWLVVCAVAMSLSPGNDAYSVTAFALAVREAGG
jgi:hypothetical protein